VFFLLALLLLYRSKFKIHLLSSFLATRNWGFYESEYQFRRYQRWVSLNRTHAAHRCTLC